MLRRAAHQRRRDRARRGCRHCGGPCWPVEGRRARRRGARLQPLGHRPLDHLSPRPLWVHRGRLRGRHQGLRVRRHARGLRPAGGARPDRRVPARPGRLGHQPRLQPRRRHHLLGHRRGRARGHRARRPGDRRLPAVAGARDGLPARRRASTSTSPAAFAARAGRPARRRAAARRARCSTSTCPAGEPDGVELAAAYAEAVDVKDKIKVSTKIRLQEMATTRLLSKVSTAVPAPESLRSIKARNAVNKRWHPDAG